MRVKITLLLTLALFFSQRGTAQCDGATFEEENGIVVIQAESGNLSGSWQRQTSFSGYTGSSYIVWTGQEYFNNPGNGIINYTVRINSPGTYRFNWRSRVGIGNEFTEHNDTWLRIQGADDFYGQRGNSRVYPNGSGKSPNPEGASANGWFKVYISNLDWIWQAKTSDFDPHDIYARFDQPGVYTIQLSARSRGHLIDRMVMYKESQYSDNQAQNNALAETRCDGSTNPPPPPPDDGGGDSGPNTPPSVSITSPSNGQNFDAGSNIRVLLNASDPDGSISQHRIFVNGNLVDTDGSSYSIYTLQNVAAGNYQITARVTDNGGASAESTVNITVGNTSPPPPPDDEGGSGGGNTPPSVTISNPNNGANFNVGNSVSVQLNANDPDGNIVQHRIFVNGTLVDTDGSGYTPHAIQNMAAGTYEVTARVTDNDGATGEDTVTFTVGGTAPPPSGGGNTPPSVSITNPNNGQNFAVGSDVSVQLSANDPDGSIVQHQIFVNGTLVDTDGSNYTPHPIRNMAAGNYEVTARVTDNDGASTETSVNFTVGGAGGNDGGGTPPPSPGDYNLQISLINANTDQFVRFLFNGATVGDGQDRNIEASTNAPGAGSVTFQVSGPINSQRTESIAPYALFGDNAGDFIPRDLPDGNYTVTATFYSGSNGSGEVIIDRTVTFSVNSGSGSGKVETELPKAIVYPNPVPDGQITVKLPVPLQGRYGYQLMAPNGQIVDYGVRETGFESDTAQLYLKGLEQSQEGIYYLTLTDGVHTFSVPVVKK